MQRLFRLIILSTMIVGMTCIIAPGDLFAVNRIRLECPPDHTTDGDSVGIRVMIENDSTLGGFSLGFKYNSNDIEVTSVQQGPAFPPPPAFQLAIRGERFELGELLSAAAEVNLAAALEFTGRLLARRDVESWEQFVEVCKNLR